MAERRIEKNVGKFALAGSIAGIPFGIPLLGIVLGALAGATWAVTRPDKKAEPES